jgi:hypothetical protein
MPFKNIEDKRAYRRRWYNTRSEETIAQHKAWQSDWYKRNIQLVQERSKAQYQKKSMEAKKKALANAAVKRRSVLLSVRDYKVWKGCMDCGHTDWRVLEFDHRDPTTKTKGVAQLLAQQTSHYKLWAEIDKCDVVCANCHRIRTAKHFNWE